MAKQLKGAGSMMNRSSAKIQPPELKAAGVVYSALSSLDRTKQVRALRFVAEMLDLDLGEVTRSEAAPGISESRVEEPALVAPASTLLADKSLEEVEGISAVAAKWMKRSGLDSKGLQALFSLGIDEIDLVAQSVPGQSKRERMRSVILLKGIAAYLGTGVARVSYEQMKEACLHYKAYDATNFATYLKAFNAEVSGGKETGYTLTARGLAAATDLVKEMLAGKG